MFKVVQKNELNQISLTGMRALLLVGLLIQAPRTLDEIRNAFIHYNIMEEGHSDDIIRIDLNTLRAMGCEISKATAKTGFKYVLTKHPFGLKITQDEILILNKAYKFIKEKEDIKTLLEFDALFKKIAEHVVDDDEIKEQLYGISFIKDFSVELIEDLLKDCKYKNVLDIIYQKPTEVKESYKKIIAQKLVFKNDKIYLYGYDFDRKDSIILNLKRIKRIVSRVIGDDNNQCKITKVKFHLKNFGVVQLNEDENIIESNENGYIIDAEYHNDFVAMQRILSFGMNCTVLEPLEFKDKVVQKLKSMRKIYEE